MTEAVLLRPDYEIARVIKGGWQLAGGHGTVDRARSIADMEPFLDAGITAFDCADIYVGVEELIGDFIDGIRKNRGSEIAGRIKIHTKLVPDMDQLDIATAADIEAIVDRSLRRLRVEQLDLVQFFWWDLARGNPYDVLACLKDIQARGKIRLLGTTNWDTRAMEPFIDAGLDLVSTQVQYSLLDNRPAGQFTRWCASHNMKILSYGVLAGGFLTPKWLGSPDPGYEFTNRSLIKYRLIIDEFGGWDLFQQLMSVLDAIAAKHNVTLDAVACRWVLEQQQVAAVIIGARTASHLPQTLAIFSLALDDDDRSNLDVVLSKRQGPLGAVYDLEGDRTGRHGRIMKYNLGGAQ